MHDMDVREETIQWDTEDEGNNNHMSGDHPYEDGTGHIRLHFCVYTKKGTMSFSSVVGQSVKMETSFVQSCKFKS